MKWMALDIGDKRIGIAVSDEEEKFFFPRGTFVRKARKKDIIAIADKIKDEHVGGVVYGLPYNMDDSLGFQAEKTERFIKQLKKRIQYVLDLEIRFESIDERLTSLEAEDIMLSQDFSREKRKQHIDAIAASIILQRFLEGKR